MKPSAIAVSFAVSAAMLCGAAVLRAQTAGPVDRASPPPATAAEIQAGKVLFDAMCTRCHGVGGTGAEGPNLNRAKLTRATDEETLRTIIREGIADSGMPRVRRFTDDELGALAAYVRSLGRTPAVPVKGDPQHGRELYDRLGCASCHTIEGQGGAFGPELSAIGYAHGPAYLRQAIVDPAAALPVGQMVVPGRGFAEYLPVRVVTSDGREVRGVRVNEDAFTIQIRDQNNQFYSFRKSALEQMVKERGKSLMPTFKDRLAPADLDDLVAFLSRLGGGQ